MEAMREAAGPLDAGNDPEAEMAFHRADVGFHEAVAMAGGNRILTCLFEAMALPLQRSFFMSRRGRSCAGRARNIRSRRTRRSSTGCGRATRPGRRRRCGRI